MGQFSFNKNGSSILRSQKCDHLYTEFKVSPDGNHAKSLLKHETEDTSLLSKISGIIDIIPDNILLPYLTEDLFLALYCKNEKLIWKIKKHILG